MAFWFFTNGIFAYMIYPGMFSTHMLKTTILFGFVPVTLNLCHAACHFITGGLGLVAVLRRDWTIVYALVATVCYIAWGTLGLVGGESVRHHLGVDVFGSWVHVIEGIILFLIWANDPRLGKRRFGAQSRT